MPEVLLSSICIPKSHLLKLCEYLIGNGLDKIELSGNLRHLPEQELQDIIKTYKERIQFYVHNYFPLQRSLSFLT